MQQLYVAVTVSGSSPTAKPESATTVSDMEAPWLGVMASYRAEDAVNICRLSVRSNLNPNVPCCVSPTIGPKHDSS